MVEWDAIARAGVCCYGIVASAVHVKASSRLSFERRRHCTIYVIRLPWRRCARQTFCPARILDG